MLNLTNLAETMQSLLTNRADELARETGFVVRQRKVSGANFAQTMVFTYLGPNDGTKDSRRHTAATVGLVITDKGLEKRNNAKAVKFLEAMIQEAVSKAVADPVLIPLLQRFTAVELLDSSTIASSRRVGRLLPRGP